MKILFLSDNFPPEVNAPAMRTYDHCRIWARLGAEVTVITCAPNFPKGKVYQGYRNSLRSTEMMDGIKVIRVWSYMAPNKGFLKRTLDYISYSASAFIAGLAVETDIIVATSPQFFTALAGRMLSRWKRKPWIMEVRDLWPKSIKEVGAMKDNAFIRYFERKERQCYRSASHIVVVTDSFSRELVENGVEAGKISTIKNGVDRKLFFPVEKDSRLINELGLQGKIVVGYIGTHGMAHKLDFILRCASHLGESEYHFLLIGDGAERENLIRQKEELGCANVTMIEAIPKHEVKRYISILDICLINLKKSELFTTVIPSKIFENAAMGIPILMGVEGEAKEIIESHGAGVCFQPENEEDFVEKLHRLRDKDFYARCQEGCARLSGEFDRETLAERMLRIITAVKETGK